MFLFDRIAFAVSFAVFAVSSLAFCSGCGTESDEPEGASAAPSAALLDACDAATTKITTFGEADGCAPADVEKVCDATHPNNRCEAEYVDFYACLNEQATVEDCVCESNGNTICNETEAACDFGPVLDCLNEG